MSIDVTGAGHVPLPREAVFAAVADLATYPHWLGIVLTAAAEPGDGIDGPAWRVEIGARLGPLRRAKRLRMARTHHDPPTAVRFERHEHDGQDHSPWVLTATLAGTEATDLAMELHYGGGFPLPGLDRILQQEIKRAPGRLYRYLAD